MSLDNTSQAAYHRLHPLSKGSHRLVSCPCLRFGELAKYVSSMLHYLFKLSPLLFDFSRFVVSLIKLLHEVLGCLCLLLHFFQECVGYLDSI